MPVDLLINIISSPACPANCQVFEVSEDMREIIESFVLYTHTSAEEWQLALTEGKACMGFLLDHSTPYCFVSGRKERQYREAYMSGTLLENTYLKKPASGQQLLLVRFTDRGLYKLLHKPLTSFRHQSSYNLQAVFGPDASALLTNIKKVALVEDKVKLIEDFFRRKARCSVQDTRLLEKALQIIRSNQGQVRIGHVAAALQVNYKWLERNFQKFIGLSPKEFARNCRFIYTYSQIASSQVRNLLDTALDNGYYDEHHLVKEYKKFTGKSPSQAK